MGTRRDVVVDIEGTISSIAFVREVLFPHARRHLRAFVESRGREPEVRRWLDAVPAADDAARIQALEAWIDEDRKHTALKALQGMIWRDGYACGAYRAHVYPDAARALAAWRAAGHRLHVYSSGSVEAQRLFFTYSEAGDLSGLFSGFFDTTIGDKRAPASYLQIASAAGRPPGELLFLSDVVEELDAARTAGLATVLVDRRPDHPSPRVGPAARGHPRVESLEAVLELRNP